MVARIRRKDRWRSPAKSSSGRRLVPADLRCAPHHSCHLSDEVELAPLVVFGYAIPFQGGGESALRAQRQSLERDEGSRFVQSRPDLLYRLKLRLLGRDQPQHGHAVLGQVSERLEAAGSLSVVLQHEAVEMSALEHLRDRLIPAAGVVVA